jgi:hypothetical protein
VQQASLASCEYPKGTDEFVKAGFTALKSEIVKPFRVKESPVQLECKLLQVIETGQEGGAGNLVICELVRMHIDDNILDEQGRIDPHKIDLVARMGGDYYCRASGSAVFEVAKPNMQLGVGVDALPHAIRNSSFLTGNNLGLLANCTAIPVISGQPDDERLVAILKSFTHDEEVKKAELHQYAKEMLDGGKVEKAWQILLAE